MKRLAPWIGWGLLAGYLALIAASDIIIVVELYRPPSGPWPGWLPMIEANLVYGGIGIIGALAVRWVWRRRFGKPNPIGI